MSKKWKLINFFLSVTNIHTFMLHIINICQWKSVYSIEFIFIVILFGLKKKKKKKHFKIGPLLLLTNPCHTIFYPILYLIDIFITILMVLFMWMKWRKKKYHKSILYCHILLYLHVVLISYMMCIHFPMWNTYLYGVLFFQVSVGDFDRFPFLILLNLLFSSVFLIVNKSLGMITFVLLLFRQIISRV